MSMKSYEDSAEERERPLFWENHEALWESSQEASPWRPLEKMGGQRVKREPREQTRHPPSFQAGLGGGSGSGGPEGQREVFGGLRADC